jgi:hypothetical protein
MSGALRYRFDHDNVVDIQLFVSRPNGAGAGLQHPARGVTKQSTPEVVRLVRRS